MTNSEVITQDRVGVAAVPVSQSSNQQVWITHNPDASYTVALFNLGSSSNNVTVNWNNFGQSGSLNVRDMWSHQNLGSFSGSFTANIPSHGTRLLKITP